MPNDYPPRDAAMTPPPRPRRAPHPRRPAPARPAAAALLTAALLAAAPAARSAGAQAAGAQAPARRSHDAAVRLTVGSLGAGAEVAKLLGGHVAARVGANVFGYSRTQEVDEVSYAGRVQLRSASVLLDLYPRGAAASTSPAA
jgi:uncharacterized protein (DUF2252 family)